MELPSSPSGLPGKGALWGSRGAAGVWVVVGFSRAVGLSGTCGSLRTVEVSGAAGLWGTVGIIGIMGASVMVEVSNWGDLRGLQGS